MSTFRMKKGLSHTIDMT